MSDAQPPHHQPASPEELEEQLHTHGPTLRRQQRAMDEIDPGFRTQLRDQLMGDKSLSDTSQVARGARPLRLPRFIPAPRLTGGILALVATVVALIFATRPGSTPFRSFIVPNPSRADLVANFPHLPGLGADHGATQISIIGAGPRLFRSFLHLTAPRLPTTLPSVRAYMLARPRITITQPLMLDIHGRLRHVTRQGERWLVASDGGHGQQPLHSLAQSLTTGQLVYHDHRNASLKVHPKPLSRAHVVEIGRSWLALLGWPANRMPVQSVILVPGRPMIRQVSFGWAGVGQVAIASATLWVTPVGSVIEAAVWPPVAQSRTISGRSVAAAWSDVRSGRVPLVVRGATNGSNGHGRLNRYTAIFLLSHAPTHRLFLVPAYQFQGNAQFGASSARYRWLTFSPIVP